MNDEVGPPPPPSFPFLLFRRSERSVFPNFGHRRRSAIASVHLPPFSSSFDDNDARDAQDRSPFATFCRVRGNGVGVGPPLLSSPSLLPLVVQSIQRLVPEARASSSELSTLSRSFDAAL